MPYVDKMLLYGLDMNPRRIIVDNVFVFISLHS
jgi:hypothetical protein